MKRLDGKKYLIRKLKLEFVLFLLAVSFVGAQNVLAEEVAIDSASYRRKQTSNNGGIS